MPQGVLTGGTFSTTGCIIRQPNCFGVGATDGYDELSLFQDIPSKIISGAWSRFLLHPYQSEVHTIDLPNCTYITPSAFDWVSFTSFRSISLPMLSILDDWGFFNNTQYGRFFDSLAFPACETIVSMPSILRDFYHISYDFPVCAEIEADALQGARMSSISLPLCSFIGSYAFQFCRELQGVMSLPNIVEIQDSAFQECYLLNTFYFGSSLTSLGNYVFRQVPLSAIYMNISVLPEITSLTFSSVGYNSYPFRIYIPTSVYENLSTIIESMPNYASLSSNFVEWSDWDA